MTRTLHVRAQMVGEKPNELERLGTLLASASTYYRHIFAVKKLIHLLASLTVSNINVILRPAICMQLSLQYHFRGATMLRSKHILTMCNKTTREGKLVF